MAALTATVAAWASAAVAAGSAISQHQQANKSRATQERMGREAGDREKQLQLQASTERAQAETDAAQASNSKLAARNRARQASSLLAKPTDSTTSDVSVLGGGKTTLGQ